MKIVIVTHQGLGDVIMTIPLIRKCDNNLSKKDRLIIIVKSENEASLIRNIPWNAEMEIFISPRNRTLFLRMIYLTMLLRFRNPDVLIAPLLFNKVIYLIWVRLVGAERSYGPYSKFWRIGFDNLVEKRGHEHKVEYYCRFADEAGFTSNECLTVRIEIPDWIMKNVVKRVLSWKKNRKWIALAPGSGELERHKRWPASSFRDLASKILDLSDDIGLIIFGHMQERTLLNTIFEGLSTDSERCIVYAGNNLVESIALLSNCCCLVTGCSGSSHMAAAAGIPIIGLYGPTDPYYTGPYTGDLQIISLKLPCSPCYHERYLTGCGNPRCMEEIEVDVVVEAVLKVISP